MRWFHLKILIFCQVMAKIGAHAHFWAYRFGNYSAIFGPIGLKFFMATQEAIIYRLVVRNLSYDDYLTFLIFRAYFGGTIGVANTRALNDLGSPKFGVRTRQKIGPVGGTFGPITISKSCFRDIQE